MKKRWFIFLAVFLHFLITGCREQADGELLKPSMVTCCIEYEFTMQSNDQVGDEWDTAVVCNGEEIQSGETVRAYSNKTVMVTGIVTEEDTVPDGGSGVVVLATESGANGSTEIIVRENRGRYSGNEAVWVFKCRVLSVK